MTKLREPVAIVAPVRTPVGRLGGMLAAVEPYLLLAGAFRGTVFECYKQCRQFRSVLAGELAEGDEAEAEKRLGTGERVALKGILKADDVIVGNVRNGIGNIARVAALEAGIPEDIPAMTIDRQCASSMEALALAAAKIAGGLADKILVGGVESASQAPWLYQKTSRAYGYFEPKPYTIRMSSPAVGDPSMGETAETLADDFRISREEMDAYATESHRKAAEAQKDGRFAREMWTLINDAQGRTIPVDAADECVRPDTSPEKLARLPAVFRSGGRVTAGNSSPLNDAAASCFVMSAAEAEREGVTVDAWIRGVCAVGLDPTRMGLGPALAIPKLLEECGLGMDDIDLFEINEAFAAQVLAVLRMMEREGNPIPLAKLNVNGGALALGHPLGATGLRISITLIRALQARGLKRGVASLCVGGGQGMAILVEVPG